MTNCAHRTNHTAPTRCHTCTHPPTTGGLCRYCGTRMTLPADHQLGAHLECFCHHHIDLRRPA